MRNHRKLGARRIGLNASALLALVLATAGPAAAATSTDSTPPTPAIAAAAIAPGSASVANGTRSIRGTAANDNTGVRLAAGDPTTVQVDFGDDQFKMDGAFTNPAIVDGGSGNDTITGGQGNDTLLDLSAAGTGDGKPDVLTVNGSNKNESVSVGPRATGLTSPA